MKKVIMILFMFLFLTGCQVKYTFDADKIEEEITLLNNNSYYDLDSISDSLNQIIDINSDEAAVTGYYNFTKIIGDYKSGIKLDYKYANYTSYKNYSPFLNGCFEKVNISEKNNILTIKTSDKISCSENFDDLEVTIKVKGKLISTNASKKKNNEYIWNLENNENRGIELKVERAIEKKYTSYSYAIILVISIILVAIVSFMVYNKSKRVNKI